MIFDMVFSQPHSKQNILHFFSLLDIDECTSGDMPHNCHSDATCNNTKGSFNCTCHKGYEGDGVNCTGK